MTRPGVLLLVALVLCAGCSAGPGPTTPDADETPASERPGGTPATTDATLTPVANPWGERTLTVAVDAAASPWRNFTGIVAGVLDYWEANDGEYAAYEVDYDLDPDAENPDVVVRLAPDLRTCGSNGVDGSVGFARRIDADSQPERPELVCVKAGYTDESTRTILAHEFGHLLGLEHGDEPLPLMNTRYPRVRLPRPSRAVREFQWPDDRVTVYADFDALYARRQHVARRQVGATLDYFERGADGTLARNRSFVLTENRSAADVVVTFPDRSPCAEPEWGTCGWLEPGPDSPTFRVTVTNLHEDAIGWYLGYWLAFTLEPTHKDELPPPLRTSTYDDRRSQWWTDSRDVGTAEITGRELRP